MYINIFPPFQRLVLSARLHAHARVRSAIIRRAAALVTRAKPDVVCCTLYSYNYNAHTVQRQQLPAIGSGLVWGKRVRCVRDVYYRSESPILTYTSTHIHNIISDVCVCISILNITDDVDVDQLSCSSSPIFKKKC